MPLARIIAQRGRRPCLILSGERGSCPASSGQLPQRRPSSRLQADDRRFASARCSGVQVHRRALGTPAITWATCWPHPVHVVFLQALQVVGRHMGPSPFGVGSGGQYTPMGISSSSVPAGRPRANPCPRPVGESRFDKEGGSSVCSPAVCPTCQKSTYSGCGQHVEEVLASVPPERRCVCP